MKVRKNIAIFRKKRKRVSRHDYSKLEDRRLLAIWLADGVLTFGGSDVNDQVEFSLSPNLQTVTVVHSQNDVPFESASFSRNSVNEIAAYPASGNDTITNATSIRSTMFGGDGDDTLTGGTDFDRLFGSDGNDEINGGGGPDIVNGLAGDDMVSGGDGTDLVVGDLGNDLLSGGDGDDLLIGGVGDDRISGNDGADRIFGSDGVDRIYGGQGNDIALAGNDGDDLIYGDEGDDNLFGGDGDDRLLGESGNDQLAGGDGADTLWGGWGNDVLIGEAGNDSLIGIGAVIELENFQTATFSHQPHPDPTPKLPENNFLFGGNDNDRYYSYGVSPATTFGLKLGTDLYAELAEGGNDTIYRPFEQYNFDLDLAPSIGTISFSGNVRVVNSNAVSNIEGFTTSLPDVGSPV